MWIIIFSAVQIRVCLKGFSQMDKRACRSWSLCLWDEALVKLFSGSQQRPAVCCESSELDQLKRTEWDGQQRLTNRSSASDRLLLPDRLRSGWNNSTQDDSSSQRQDLVPLSLCSTRDRSETSGTKQDLHQTSETRSLKSLKTWSSCRSNLRWFCSSGLTGSPGQEPRIWSWHQFFLGPHAGSEFLQTFRGTDWILVLQLDRNLQTGRRWSSQHLLLFISDEADGDDATSQQSADNRRPPRPSSCLRSADQTWSRSRTCFLK